MIVEAKIVLTVLDCDDRVMTDAVRDVADEMVRHVNARLRFLQPDGQAGGCASFVLIRKPGPPLAEPR